MTKEQYNGIILQLRLIAIGLFFIAGVLLAS